MHGYKKQINIWLSSNSNLGLSVNPTTGQHLISLSLNSNLSPLANPTTETTLTLPLFFSIISNSLSLDPILLISTLSQHEPAIMSQHLSSTISCALSTLRGCLICRNVPLMQCTL